MVDAAKRDRAKEVVRSDGDDEGKGGCLFVPVVVRLISSATSAAFHTWRPPIL